MEHVRIATYEIKQGSFQEIAEAAKGGMLRKFQDQPGFIRGVADLGVKPFDRPVGDPSAGRQSSRWRR
jgi:hypothetical protein